jgi:hypothetical protein
MKIVGLVFIVIGVSLFFFRSKINLFFDKLKIPSTVPQNNLEEARQYIIMAYFVILGFYLLLKKF